MLISEINQLLNEYLKVHGDRKIYKIMPYLGRKNIEVMLMIESGNPRPKNDNLNLELVREKTKTLNKYATTENVKKYEDDILDMLFHGYYLCYVPKENYYFVCDHNRHHIT